MLFLNFDCSADNCLCLHLSDFRISYSKTTSTMSHHWVELMQGSDDCFDILNGFTLCISQFLNISFLCRNELMKRWIQETDGNRISFQSFIQCFEVSLLIWKNLIKSSLTLFYCIGADHLTESSNSVFLEEHMLCTAKSDTLSAKLTSFLSICRCICICTNFHCTELVSPFHNTAELTCDCSINSFDNAIVDVTGRTIN